MKVAILDEDTVLNVVVATNVLTVTRSEKLKAGGPLAEDEDLDARDLPDGMVIEEAAAWMGPGKSYSGDAGERVEVLAELSEEEQAAILAAAESVLYYACLAYQNDRMDTNTSNEVTKSEVLVESGIAQATDLPKAQAVGDWIESLWEEYFSRKENALTASIDFTGFDPIPYTFIEIRTERKDFLAAQ